jgi:hypothetical protein
MVGFFAHTKFTVDHLFLASILFRVYKVLCLSANTKICESRLKMILKFANRSTPVVVFVGVGWVGVCFFWCHSDRGIVY